ncbi:hypothetical protein Sango_2768500 [Sesamum angolense]|uniref:RNase H type-1 domain-containing protein n=1 Tax=Sesamum angolense TaxID=2727404 RepID=A0AAE1T8K2_9LAMI|nr:hypothetical protein Sango_2768500 [Sesamum angolense]
MIISVIRYDIVGGATLGPQRKELHGIANRQSVFDSNSAEENIAQTYHITLIEDGEVEEEDAEDAPAELEEGIKATIDELKEVNLGDIENPRPIYISALLTHGEEGTYIALLHEFKDIFAWSYKEMPGLDPKNASVTYQRAMQKIFDDMLHKNVECYVDDLVMNPSKCAFGVTSRKFLRFIVRQRGIEIEQAKIDAILGMTEPRNIHELKSLQGKLAYLQSIHLVSNANPLKYVMAKPVLSDRLARWYLQLQQFEITYVPQKAVKGQVLADFLADHPMPAEWELSDDLHNEDVLVIEITPPWRMYFDRASHKEGAGAGVVFVTSKGEVLPYSFTLTQNCSNNVAEYQALILGLEIVVHA